MKYTEEEKKAVANIKKNLSFNLRNPFLDDEADNIEILLNLLDKQHEQLERIKEYVHQEIAHYTEDIKDYMDDDKVGNAEYISELKENREHWKDIEKILEGKLNDDLYMNWWRYGLYE